MSVSGNVKQDVPHARFTDTLRFVPLHTSFCSISQLFTARAKKSIPECPHRFILFYSFNIYLFFSTCVASLSPLLLSSFICNSFLSI